VSCIGGDQVCMVDKKTFLPVDLSNEEILCRIIHPCVDLSTSLTMDQCNICNASIPAAFQSDGTRIFRSPTSKTGKIVNSMQFMEMEPPLMIPLLLYVLCEYNSYFRLHFQGIRKCMTTNGRCHGHGFRYSRKNSFHDMDPCFLPGFLA